MWKEFILDLGGIHTNNLQAISRLGDSHTAIYTIKYKCNSKGLFFFTKQINLWVPSLACLQVTSSLHGFSFTQAIE